MDFREYASKETADLAARLTTAAATAAESAVQTAVQKAKDEAQKVAESLRAELKTAGEQKAATAASLKEAQAHVERLRTDLKAATDRIESASRQLDEARKTAEKLETVRGELTAARDAQAAARKTAETDLRKAQETVDSLRGELASAMQTLEKASAERLAAEEAAAAATSATQAAEAKLTAVTDLFKNSAGRIKTLEQAQVEYERKIEALEAKLHAGTAAAASAPAPSSLGTFDDLLASFQAIAASTSIADVLTTLLEQMACQFPRVALFRLRKGHLQGEHQIGFDLKTDIGKLVLPLGMDSLPSRAASSGQIESLTGEDLKQSRMPFTGTPSCALAIPIVVGGETLAVVYTDDSGASKRTKASRADELHVRYAELMRQYAVAVLMRLTNELKAVAELQKYAVSLLTEIEQMYTADAEAGMNGGELQKRLAGNLDYARSIYGSRTALESADAATLIDDELAALIEARKGTPFAKDLAAAAGHAVRNAAEAS